MPENPSKPLERIDPQLLKVFSDTRQLAFQEGGIPRKYKLLIALALEASNRVEGGVNSLAQQALPGRRLPKR